MRDKSRWVELGKDALIVLLTLSAVWLLSMTPLIQDSGMLDLLAPRESPGMGQPGGGQAAAMLPVRLAVTGEGGRFGVQYDEARLEEQFPPLGALLGDALASAGQPQAMGETEWRRCLGADGVYFDFAGDVPLSALERWLQGPGETELTGSARRVLLCAGEGDQVLLCWQETADGRFFSCSTGLARSLHLEPVVENAAFNGAYFAFENPALTDRLAPYTLITEGELGGAGYAVSVPLTGEAETLTVLAALDFNSQNPAPVIGGEVYLDGGDRLVVSTNGTVTYRAAGGEKYPVGYAPAGGAVRRGPAVPHVCPGGGRGLAGALRLPAERLHGVSGQRGLGGGIFDFGRLYHPVHPALPQLCRQWGAHPAAAHRQGGGHAARFDRPAAGAGAPVPGQRRRSPVPRLGGGVKGGG